MRTSPQLVLVAAIVALACGVAAAIIAIHVIQTALGS